MKDKRLKLFEYAVIAGVASIAVTAVYAQAANNKRFKLVAVKTLEADSGSKAAAPATAPTPTPVEAKTISEKGVSSSKPHPKK